MLAPITYVVNLLGWPLQHLDGSWEMTVASIAAARLGMIFLLEKINMTSGSCYEATDLANAVLSIPIIAQDLKQFSITWTRQYTFTVFP